MRTCAVLCGWLTVLCLGTAACRSETPTSDLPPAVTEDTYVSVMVDLLMLDSEPTDDDTEEERQAALDSARVEILASHGVTAADLIAFVNIAGRDPGRMEGMWHRVTQVFDSVRAEGLKRDTEARTESEGKLGDAARQAADTAGASAAGARVPGQPIGADSTLRRQLPRSRDFLDSLRRSRTRRAEAAPDG